MWEYPGQYGRFDIYGEGINYCYSKLHQMLAGDNHLSQTSSILTSKGYLNKLSSHSKTKFKTCGKKLSLPESFEKSKIALFCFFSCCTFNFYQCFTNQRLVFYYKKKKIKPRKQSLKQHKTGPRYSSAHVIDLELKTYEKNI